MFIETTITRAKNNNIKYLHHFKCDKCNIDFIRKVPLKQRNNEFNHFCILHKASFSSRKNKRDDLIVGLKRIDSHGYISIYLGRENKRKGRTQVREHIIVMEKFLNRFLEKDEIIHHIDGNKQNNNLDNLYLTTHSHHSVCHAGLETIGFELFKKGIIKFNKEIGRYYINVN